jgi:hypothetical protein
MMDKPGVVGPKVKPKRVDVLVRTRRGKYYRHKNVQMVAVSAKDGQRELAFGCDDDGLFGVDEIWITPGASE